MHNPLIVTVFATEQVGVDFLLSVPCYEDVMFERAVRRRLDDFEVWVCTPEDLIIHKAIANRPKDWSDVEGVLSNKWTILITPTSRIGSTSLPKPSTGPRS